MVIKYAVTWFTNTNTRHGTKLWLGEFRQKALAAKKELHYTGSEVHLVTKHYEQIEISPLN